MKVCMVFIAAVSAVSCQFGFNHDGFLFGSTHESSEEGTVRFFYDPLGNYLVMKTESYCYIMTLDVDQQQTVHTTRGMEDLEVAMISMVKGGEDTVLISQLQQHTSYLDNLCSHRKMYKIGDVSVQALSTVTMP